MAEFVVARLATAKNDVTLLENAICLPMKHKNPFNTYLWRNGISPGSEDFRREEARVCTRTRISY